MHYVCKVLDMLSALLHWPIVAMFLYCNRLEYWRAYKSHRARINGRAYKTPKSETAKHLKNIKVNIEEASATYFSPRVINEAL